MEAVLKSYKSRRNSACLVDTSQGRVVCKTIAEEAAFQRELEVYSLLQNKDLPCARVLGWEGKTLRLSYLPGKTLVDCLEQQEEAGLAQWEIWEKLVGWLAAFHRLTGLVMIDVNLRNFLYDEETKTLYGLDFEECSTGSMLICAASVAAFIRTYKPENTPLKQAISQYILKQFADCCNLEVEALHLETERQEEKILQRRSNKI